jgi:hypothetical protein
MHPDAISPLLLVACVALGGFVALPAAAAFQLRRRSRECSDLALQLVEYAASVRRDQRVRNFDDSLLERARSLGVPETLSFGYLRGIANPDPDLLADAAQRLALRLKRRVAFARKMLARTASGRRRAALAASTPACLLMGLGATGVVVPAGTLLVLLTLEGIGCWLVWNVARVEV